MTQNDAKLPGNLKEDAWEIPESPSRLLGGVF
jgi:hypothetical protein